MYDFVFLPESDINPPLTALSRPVFLMGILYSLHLATSFNGERGSVDDSTRSEIVNVVPSTSRTTAVSDLGPDNSTATILFAESLSMTSNSAVVTDGITSALLLPLLDVTIGRIRRVEDVLARRFDRNGRRSVIG